MIRDSQSRRMSPRHAGKPNRRYRYYVSVNDDTTSHGSTPAIVRVAAGEVEAATVVGLTGLLNNSAVLIASLALEGRDAAGIDDMQRRAADISAEIGSMSHAAMRELLVSLELQVVIDGDVVAATVGREQLAARLGIMLQVDPERSPDERCNIAMASGLLRTGHEVRLAIAPVSSGAPTSRDGSLVALIVKAHQARDLLVEQGASSDAASTLSHRHLTRLARLA